MWVSQISDKNCPISRSRSDKGSIKCYTSNSGEVSLDGEKGGVPVSEIINEDTTSGVSNSDMITAWTACNRAYVILLETTELRSHRVTP